MRYVVCMTVNVQIRNVPEELVATLKARAAAQRRSLSDFLLDELRQIAATPALEDVLDELDARPRRHLDTTGAEAVRAARAEMGWD